MGGLSLCWITIFLKKRVSVFPSIFVSQSSESDDVALENENATGQPEDDGRTNAAITQSNNDKASNRRGLCGIPETKDTDNIAQRKTRWFVSSEFYLQFEESSSPSPEVNYHDTMDAAEEEGGVGGNNSDDGAQEGRGHSNTWDFEEGEYLLWRVFQGAEKKTAHDVSHAAKCMQIE